MLEQQRNYTLDYFFFLYKCISNSRLLLMLISPSFFLSLFFFFSFFVLFILTTVLLRPFGSRLNISSNYPTAVSHIYTYNMLYLLWKVGFIHQAVQYVRYTYKRAYICFLHTKHTLYACMHKDIYLDGTRTHTVVQTYFSHSIQPSNESQISIRTEKYRNTIFIHFNRFFHIYIYIHDRRRSESGTC